MEDLNFLHSNFDVMVNKPQLDVNEEHLSLIEDPQILIVEDDHVLGTSIKKYFSKKISRNIELFENSEKCLDFLAKFPKDQPFGLLTDISLGQSSDGLVLIDIVKERGYKFFPIVMTGFGSIENAISATKKGVLHYLTKPFELGQLEGLMRQSFVQKFDLVVKNQSSAINRDFSLSENRGVSKKIGVVQLEPVNKADSFHGMIGRSQGIHGVFERIEKVSESDSTVLITGQSGTGKELVARAIHQISRRRERPQVSVNCGAIPRDLLESELFGHMKGSFTGAISNRKGRFELANNGTIFLDEIGDMPLMLQVKLLRVLQQKTIEPVGSGNSIPIDTRIIAATHRDLEKLVLEGKFREDLFYRLNVIPIRVPALKERKEDIPLLISYFKEKFESADKSNEINFSEGAFEMLLQYDWPGNIRELENVVERMVILRGGNTILPEDLPAKIYRHNPLMNSSYKELFKLPEDGVNLKQILSDIEDSLIIQALNKTAGNKNQASKLLEMNRTTLIEKMKKKNLEL